LKRRPVGTGGRWLPSMRLRAGLRCMAQLRSLDGGLRRSCPHHRMPNDHGLSAQAHAADYRKSIDGWQGHWDDGWCNDFVLWATTQQNVSHLLFERRWALFFPWTLLEIQSPSYRRDPFGILLYVAAYTKKKGTKGRCCWMKVDGGYGRTEGAGECSVVCGLNRCVKILFVTTRTVQ